MYSSILENKKSSWNFSYMFYMQKKKNENWNKPKDSALRSFEFSEIWLTSGCIHLSSGKNDEASFLLHEPKDGLKSCSQLSDVTLKSVSVMTYLKPSPLK